MMANARAFQSAVGLPFLPNETFLRGQQLQDDETAAALEAFQLGSWNLKNWTIVVEVIIVTYCHFVET